MALFEKYDEKKLRCHHTGFKDTCEQHQKHCPKWIYLRMRDPQSKQEIDEYGCSDTFAAKLSIENSRETRSVGAAVESQRNEQVRAIGSLATAVMNRPVVLQLPEKEIK